MDKGINVEEEIFNVTIDRPIGSSHPDYPSLVYPVNYGYIEGVIAPDGENQDAYVIGECYPRIKLNITVTVNSYMNRVRGDAL